MASTTGRRVDRLAATAALASAACVTLALFASPVFAAAEEPALRASISEPAAVAPGGRGEVTYRVTNVSDKATEAILLNISLPPYVRLESDERCEQTGLNDDGGALISCNIGDQLGKLAPDETTVATDTPFFVAYDAPQSTEPTELGQLGALVVPLHNGEPTEDPADLDGHNVVWTTITTSASLR